MGVLNKNHSIVLDPWQAHYPRWRDAEYAEIFKRRCPCEAGAFGRERLSRLLPEAQRTGRSSACRALALPYTLAAVVLRRVYLPYMQGAGYILSRDMAERVVSKVLLHPFPAQHPHLGSTLAVQPGQEGRVRAQPNLNAFGSGNKRRAISVLSHCLALLVAAVSAQSARLHSTDLT
eukprot:6200874-Pleurochrysis_carterae.AAC.1